MRISDWSSDVCSSDLHHVHRLARVHAGFDELALTFLTPVLRIVRIDHVASLVEQVALAVALEDRAEVPAMPMVICELRVLQRGVEVKMGRASCRERVCQYV